jgi:hypothetical protein
MELFLEVLTADQQEILPNLTFLRKEKFYLAGGLKKYLIFGRSSSKLKYQKRKKRKQSSGPDLLRYA